MPSKLNLGLAVAGLAANVAAQGVPPSGTFDWTSLTPSTDLVWVNCYSPPYQCARLQVPMDWMNVSNPRTVAIAMIQIPANVSQDDPTYGGPVFFNPGGPGGSGVGYLLDFGPDTQKLINTPGKKVYDMVSWDPRGTAFTTPATDCFDGNVPARYSLQFEVRGNSPWNRGIYSTNYGIGVNDAFNQRCLETNEAAGQVIGFTGTPYVARDMVEMVDKIADLRSKTEAGKRGISLEELHLEKRATGVDTTPRLFYYGVSYGSFLGNTFSALYPGRVGRLILDGNVDAQDYTGTPGWLANLNDNEKVFQTFWTGCFMSGQKTCAFFGKYPNANAAQTAFNNWLAGIDKEPIVVQSPTGSVMVLTGYDVRSFIGKALYTPTLSFQTMSTQLQEAISGNTSALVNELINETANPPFIQNSCPVNGTPAVAPAITEQAIDIWCNDAPVFDKPASYWLQYFQTLHKQAPIYSYFWNTVRFSCNRWRFNPTWKFFGPWTSPQHNPTPTVGKPLAGILFLNNVLDPVTPLQNAFKMSSAHPDSSVAVLNAQGHTTIEQPQGTCLTNIIRSYLISGALPKNGTVCQPACGVWDVGCQATITARDLSKRSTEIVARSKTRRFPLGIQ